MKTCVLVLFLHCAAASASCADLADSCSVFAVGVDTTRANELAGAYLGSAVGETFSAQDTLIRSITVWRNPLEPTIQAPMKLWIVRNTMPSGFPNWRDVVLDGPTLVVTDGDGVHPTKIQYSFDPPFALPGPGRYCFMVQDLCWLYFDLLVAVHDEYPSGELILSSRSNWDGCILSGGKSFPDYDLVFEIQFCATTTPTKRRSWGELKTIYR